MASNLIKRIVELERSSHGGELHYPRSAEELLELMRSKDKIVFSLNGQQYSVETFLDTVANSNEGYVSNGKGDC